MRSFLLLFLFLFLFLALHQGCPADPPAPVTPLWTLRLVDPGPDVTAVTAAVQSLTGYPRQIATELVARGWSQKTLLKTIVMSATYRQSSAVPDALAERDPYNRLFARGPRVRMEAEV